MLTRVVRIFITVGLLFITSIVFADEVAVNVDRQSVGLGETFQLTLTTQGSSNSQPDLTPLEKNFRIISAGRSNSFNMVNGKTSATTKWQLVLTPKKAGKLTIPAIMVGKMKSKPLTIAVVKSKSSVSTNDKNAFIITAVNQRQPYTQSQILYTVKLYYDIDAQLVSGSMSSPEVSDAIIKKLGDTINYQTTLAGKRYRVAEVRYAIFPQKAGSLTIGSPIFEGEVANTRSAFNQFFNNAVNTIRLVGKPVELKVLPVPKTNKAKNWLPAETLLLKQTWSPNPPKFKVGDPVTRTLTMEAKGLTANQLPDLSAPALANMNTYPDQPIAQNQQKDGVVIGERTQKIAFIPTKSGKVTIPAIHIRWFNTQTKEFQVATLPEKKYQVLPASQTSSNISATPIVSKSKEKSVINPGNNVVTMQQSLTKFKRNNFWIWLAALFLFAWLVTLLLLFKLWQKHTKLFRDDKDKNVIQHEESIRQLRQSLESACKASKPYDARQAIIGWAARAHAKRQVNNLDVLAKQTNNATFKAELAHLANSLYGKQQVTWDGERFWQAFQRYEKKLEEKKQNTKTDIPPLYPEGL